MSAGGPRGRTTRRSLARLHADALLLHGSEEGATAGRTPACNGRQFREFTNSIVMWAAMADAMYAKCFKDVYANPGIDVDQSVRDLPDLIREVDCKLSVGVFRAQ